MPDLRLGVLGPMTVLVDGEPVDVGGRRERTLLALLAVEVGRPVSADRLVEELWSGAPPASAQASLQTFVSRLRRLLDPAREGLISLSGAGYRLELDPDRIDAFRFQSLADRGTQALVEGRFEEAHRLLAAALGLWRGPALADFADDEFGQLAAGRLETLRLVAAEDQFEAALALGYHGALVPELDRLIEENPFRERLRGQLALALYRSGRQADALESLRRARGALDELGLEPSVALRSLESAILNQDPVLDPRPPAAAGAPPPLPAGSPAGASDFVGRERELSVVEQALEHALAGHGRILLLEGEPGIGKSRLSVEAARLAGDRAAVLFGPCYEGERAPSLWPWVAIVRAALEQLGPDAGAALEALPELLGLLPGESRAEPQQRVTADARASFALYEAVVGLLQRLCERKALLVILDDLHWADGATLQLLELLALRTVSLPLLLVGTHREHGLDEQLDLGRALATVSRYPWTTRLALEGLPYEAVSQLVRSTVGGDASNVVSVVFSRSGGNPFFATELVRLLESEGDLSSRRVYSGIPLGVRDVVRRRLSGLPEATCDLLALGAVIGRRFDPGLVAAAADIDRDACVEALEPALVARIVVPVEGRRSLLGFSHPLVSETLADDLSPSRSGRLHGQVAHALLELRKGEDDWAEETADHVRLAGTAVEAGLAVEALRRGAAIAYGRFAFDRADRLWTALIEALDDLPRGPERDRLELETLLRLVPLILAYRGSGDARVGGLFERALALAERCGEVLALVQMLLFASMSAAHRHQRGETERLIRQALSAAEAAGDPLALGHANYVIAMDDFWVGRITESRRHFAAAIGAWEQVAAGHPAAEFPTFSLYPESLFYGRAAFIEAWAGDPEGRAHEWVGHALAAADADGGPLARQISRYSACLVELATRDYEACRRFCEEGLDLPPEQRSPTYTALLRIVLAWASAMAGDCGGRAGEIDAAFEEFRAVDIDTFRRSQLCLRAEVELRCGRPAAARATVEPLLADEDDPDERYFLPWLMRLDAEAMVASIQRLATQLRRCSNGLATSPRSRAAPCWSGRRGPLSSGSPAPGQAARKPPASSSQANRATLRPRGDPASPTRRRDAMISPGQTLYNPVTGESMTFVKTAAETGGEYVRIELRADSDAFVAAAHVHPAQTETFEVLEGKLGVKVAGDKLEATAGDVLVVEPGQSHKWWNAGDGELVFRCEIRPALQFEQLIETMFSLAADGKTNRKGLPNPFRLAVVARAHLDTVVLPFPPVWMQKTALAAGAPLGRLLGYRATYQPAAASLSPVPATA